MEGWSESGQGARFLEQGLDLVLRLADLLDSLMAGMETLWSRPIQARAGMWALVLVAAVGHRAGLAPGGVVEADSQEVGLAVVELLKMG